jgi:hypothetical protein
MKEDTLIPFRLGHARKSKITQSYFPMFIQKDVYNKSNELGNDDGGQCYGMGNRRKWNKGAAMKVDTFAF